MADDDEKLTPCRTREDGTAEFDGTRWESGMHLMAELLAGRVPVPCWIRCGRTAMKIGEGEAQAMGRGMMLAHDVDNVQPRRSDEEE